MLHPTATTGVIEVSPKDRLDETSAEPTVEKEPKVQAEDRWHAWADSGIYQVFPADRMYERSAEPTLEKESKWVRVQAGDWRLAFWWAVYFALLSAVNIGFEQFTPSNWIRRLQSRDFSLEAVGWVRFVAGTQALLSVFLLAMWVLTQFGRPFD